MTVNNEVTALILAAGYSSRMGRFKPLLPIGPITALERSVQLFRDNGINDVRVVIGYQAEDLAPLLKELGVRWVVNERFQEGMLSSVQTGVRTLESSRKAFFLLPADIPLIRPGTVADLLNAYEKDSPDVMYPCFFGKRGHPPLISAGLRSGILNWDREGGLRSFLQQSQCRSVDVEVADEHILLDMDSPEHYEEICGRLLDYDIPSSKECMAILTRKLAVNGGVVAHSSKVAQVARHLTRALNKAGCRLNEKLVTAASLLHDLAKGRPDHAATGAQMITEMGHTAVAAIVAAHMKIEFSEDQPIREQGVVFLADKLVEGDRVVDLEERHQKKLEECANDRRVCEAITARLANSLRLKRKLENLLGNPMELVLAELPEENYAEQTVHLPAEAR